MEPDRNCPNNDYNWIGLPRYNPEYKKGIQSFMENAFPLFSVGDEMKCPCKDCNDRKWHLRDVIYDHLICRGPSLLHVHWICKVSQVQVKNSADFKDYDTRTTFGDNLQAMFDCTGRRFQNVEQGPNPSARKKNKTPVWTPHHELESISKVVNTKKGASTRQIGMQSKKELEKETIDEVLREGGDADAVLPDGKHGPDWLVGRQGSLLALENTPAIPQPSADELTAKITRDLESQMEAKVNRKVQENMTWFLKKLGEANPTLKFDIGDFCATFSSDQDECGTPITQTPGGATS
ncbi:hypothetical protein OROMI_021073 [Orobanche minor]